MPTMETPGTPHAVLCSCGPMHAQSTVTCPPPPAHALVREERDERISKRSQRDGEPDEEVGRR